MLREQRGAAFLITVMTMLILLTLGLTMLDTGTTEAKIAHNQLRALQAFYLAEGGLEEALHYLKGTPAFRGSLPVINVDMGQAYVTVKSLNGSSRQIEVVSVGTVEKSKATLRITGEAYAGGGYLSRPLTAYGSSQSMRSIFENNCRVVGDILINHQPIIQNNAELIGLRITDTRVGFPELPADWYKPPGLGLPHIINNNVNNTSAFVSNYHRVNGQITLDLKNKAAYDGRNVVIEATGNVILDGGNFKNLTIVTSGSIIVANNTDLENVVLSGRGIILNSNVTAQNVLLFDTKTGGDTILNSNVSFEGIILTKQKLHVNSNVDISGNVVCSHITMQGNASLTYKEDITVPIIPGELSESVVSLETWSY